MAHIQGAKLSSSLSTPSNGTDQGSKIYVFSPVGTSTKLTLLIFPCKKATGILAGSWRDLGGIPPGFPPGPAEILAAGISVSRRESRRDLGGITTGIPPRFWPPGFRFAPRALAGSPAEILVAEFSLPAVNPGGILARLPPGSRRDFGRRDFPSRQESQRELGDFSCRDFGRWGSASCRESRRDLGAWAHPPRFWSPRFPFLAENLAKIPPRFSARQD